MRHRVLLIMMLTWTTTSRADMWFDERYERDYNIFTPANRYAPDNPLNLVNKFDPDSPFNPVNRYDPDNPANPINKYNPNNPFNPVNQYHPDNPLSLSNQYNFNVPFAPLDRSTGRESRR
jgi:hypothetical protein